MIHYTDNIWILCQCQGSVAQLGVQNALPAALIAVLLDILEDKYPEQQDFNGFAESSILWNVMVSVLSILIAFRIKQALGRFWEGTSLLHQMRGEWFDAASCLITFSRDAKLRGRGREVREFRATLVRLMSLMHGSALDEISSNGKETASYFEVIDIQGLDSETLLFLRDCQLVCNFSKVEALQHLVQVLVTQNHHNGVLSTPPPILSRVYQSLSRGFVNLLNARKIKDTKFPFPFAQTIRILLVMHTLFTPMMMVTVVKAKVWAAVFSFIFMFGLSCLNCIAEQLEMPFGLDSNDLPLEEFQMEMNSTLLMLVDDRADHVPATSSTAVKDLSLKSLGSQIKGFGSMDCLDGRSGSNSPGRRSSRGSATSDLEAVVTNIRSTGRRPSLSTSTNAHDFRLAENKETASCRLGEESLTLAPLPDLVKHETDPAAAPWHTLISQLEQLTNSIRISTALESCRNSTLERVEEQLSDLCTRLEVSGFVRSKPGDVCRSHLSPPQGASTPRLSPHSLRDCCPRIGNHTPAVDHELVQDNSHPTQLSTFVKN